MQLELSMFQQQQLLDYLALLSKWNKAFNLTAVRDPDVMVSRQLLDSLSILPWIRGQHVLDVGTGAGLPGIPLAIARPDLGFTLLDSNGKKTRFVQQAVLQLGLANVGVENTRIEALQSGYCYEQITSRAFASLPDFLRLTRPLLCKEGEFLAMKAIAELDDINSLGDDLQARVEPLMVPGSDAQRRLVVIRSR